MKKKQKDMPVAEETVPERTEADEAVETTGIKPKPKKRKNSDHTPVGRRLWELPLIALVLTLFVEGLNQNSIPGLFGFMFGRPLLFGYSFLIILTSLTVSELFRRRRSALFFISVVWATLGIAGLMVRADRTQPFTSMDIYSFKDAVKLTTIYYTWPQIIAMYTGIFLAVAAVIFALTRFKKRKKVNYTVSLTVVAGMVIVCTCLGALGINRGVLPTSYDNLVETYRVYGFTTCFTLTFGNVGISRPEDYSEDTVADIVEAAQSEIGNMEETGTAVVTEESPVFDESSDLAHPNIIFVQLESFIDPNTIIGAEYTEDPTPNFTKLTSDWPHGELYVPSVGGGTVNTEFEILTGMNLDFFGVGELPYSTVLTNATAESIAYCLLDQGYGTTAIHNNTGTFYGRNEVYSRLGFQHFVSLEYIPYATYTDVGWCEDRVFVDEIFKALRADDARNFILAITVESHGKYEETYTEKPGDIGLIEYPEQMSEARLLNYLQLIHATDAFVGELTKKLSTFPEPTVVVFYGDHLPALDLSEDILTTGSLYASRYIIWNNFGLDLSAPDLQAYRLYANLFKQLGMTGGVITTLHQTEPTDSTNEEYMDKLRTLEYDLLYGDRTSYDGETPYEPVDLMMGTFPIKIDYVQKDYGRLLITGQQFTESSVIVLDGTAYPTAYISSTQLIAIVPRETVVYDVWIEQKTSTGEVLSRTDTYVLKERDEEKTEEAMQ